MIIKAIAVKDISKSGRKGPVSNANGIKQICAKGYYQKCLCLSKSHCCNLFITFYELFIFWPIV